MDVNKLLKALDNENNEQLLNFTTEKIREMNLNVLKELHLNRDETYEILNKLKDYKYVDEMNELNYGTYLRWVPLDNPEMIQLTKGAIFCEVKITDEGVFLVCKNFGFSNKHFRIKLDECLVFQKLTQQELIILAALDNLAK